MDDTNKNNDKENENEKEECHRNHDVIGMLCICPKCRDNGPMVVAWLNLYSLRISIPTYDELIADGMEEESDPVKIADQETTAQFARLMNNLPVHLDCGTKLTLALVELIPMPGHSVKAIVELPFKFKSFSELRLKFFKNSYEYKINQHLMLNAQKELRN